MWPFKPKKKRKEASVDCIGCPYLDLLKGLGLADVGHVPAALLVLLEADLKVVVRRGRRDHRLEEADRPHSPSPPHGLPQHGHTFVTGHVL